MTEMWLLSGVCLTKRYALPHSAFVTCPTPKPYLSQPVSLFPEIALISCTVWSSWTKTLKGITLLQDLICSREPKPCSEKCPENELISR